jgi:uncharacterized membrane protein required for colicin V production
MGLDLALGGLILIMAIRGWLKGFVLQAVRLGGLVACVYLADPVRDQARPYVVAYLPKIRPDVVDRLLWWSSAVASYVILVGLVSLAVKLYRRQPVGLFEPNRNDQVAGFLLGGAKGALMAVFLVAGVQRYAIDKVKTIPWADEQVRTSQALQWNERYQPAQRIWAMTPVQHFVGRIQQRGLLTPSEAASESKPVQASTSRAPRLHLPWDAFESPTLQESALDAETRKAVESFKKELQQVPRPD